MLSKRYSINYNTSKIIRLRKQQNVFHFLSYELNQMNTFYNKLLVSCQLTNQLIVKALTMTVIID